MKNKQDEILEEEQIKVTKPFGPSIAQVRIPQDLIKKLKFLISQKKRLKKVKIIKIIQ